MSNIKIQFVGADGQLQIVEKLGAIETMAFLIRNNIRGARLNFGLNRK